MKIKNINYKPFIISEKKIFDVLEFLINDII